MSIDDSTFYLKSALEFHSLSYGFKDWFKENLSEKLDDCWLHIHIAFPSAIYID